MNTLDDTVHTILEPIDLLAEQLHTWAGWIAALRASDQQLRTRLSEATHELDAMTVARGDPRYPALAQDLAAITQLTEQNGLSQLARIQQQLLGGLERLSELPAELSQLTASLDQLRTGCRPARHRHAGIRRRRGQARLRPAAPSPRTGTRSQADSPASAAERASSPPGSASSGTATQQLASGLGKLAERQRTARGRTRQTRQAAMSRLAGGLGKLTQRQPAARRRDRRARDRQRAARRVDSPPLTAAQAPSPPGWARDGRPLQSYASMLNGYQQATGCCTRDSPNALDSGYLVLTALDGTVSPTREQVAQLVNVDGGGQAARMMVVASSRPRRARPRL